jgi:A/G-specific adenine glycosylase
MENFFTGNIIDWHLKENKRIMPWKGEKDPYKIWISEIILQQTRVTQGLAYYNNFIKEFPTLNALAEAPDEAVFKVWEGLGYYSRCKNLLFSARFIVKHLHGNFPENYENLLKLKGIGPYTAAAI